MDASELFDSISEWKRKAEDHERLMEQARDILDLKHWESADDAIIEALREYAVIRHTVTKEVSA